MEDLEEEYLGLELAELEILHLLRHHKEIMVAMLHLVEEVLEVEEHLQRVQMDLELVAMVVLVLLMQLLDQLYIILEVEAEEVA
jgi:hypothetical protein